MATARASGACRSCPGTIGVRVQLPWGSGCWCSPGAVPVRGGSAGRLRCRGREHPEQQCGERGCARPSSPSHWLHRAVPEEAIPVGAGGPGRPCRGEGPAWHTGLGICSPLPLPGGPAVAQELQRVLAMAPCPGSTRGRPAPTGGGWCGEPVPPRCGQHRPMAAKRRGRAPPLLGCSRTPRRGGTGSGQHPGQAWPCRCPQPRRRSRCSLAAGSRRRWRRGEQPGGRRGCLGGHGHRWAGLPGGGAGWPGPLAPPSAGPGRSLAVPGGRGSAGATCAQRHGHSLTPARLTLPRFCLEIGHKEPPGGWLPAGRWQGMWRVLRHRGVTRRRRGCRCGSGSWPDTAWRSPSASPLAAGTDVHGTCVCVCVPIPRRAPALPLLPRPR